MTIEETIKTLEMAKAEVEWNYPLDYAMAIDKAIEELEFRKPKKPLKGGNHEEDTLYYLCPFCCKPVGASYDGNKLEVNMPCCSDCGQVIDWGKENEQDT